MTSSPALAKTAARLAGAGCVFAAEEARLLIDNADGPDELAALVSRRVFGEPLEHILGWVEFDGLHLRVGPGTFVPRQRSLFVAALAVAEARSRNGCLVLEMCSGVAPIAAVVARDVPGARVVASDRGASAEYARANVPAAAVYVGDLFEALPDELRGTVGVLAAVPPYVPDDAAGQLPREAREFEPSKALLGGHDGLAIVRRILCDAPGWLDDASVVLLEMHRSQTAAAAVEAAACGFSAEAVASSDEQTAVLRCTAPSQ